MPTRHSPDVVIIGAGVVGAACAYYAARSGLTVAVVDRGPVAGGTTGAGEGNLLVSDKEAGPELDLALLGALGEHPRAGDLELSRHTRVARATVQSRLRRLTEAGVVVDWQPTVDAAAAGFPVQAYVTLEIAQGALDEVALHLEAIPQVLEASVVAVPDERWDERPLACVVLKEGEQVTVEELREFLSEHVARWQRARAESHGLQRRREPHLVEHVEAVVARGAIGPERHADAAASHLDDRRQSRAELQVRPGAVHHLDGALRHQRLLRVRHPDAVRRAQARARQPGCGQILQVRLAP